jgi:hypothetical protein
MALSLFCGRGYKCATKKGQGLPDALTGEAMREQARRGRLRRRRSGLNLLNLGAAVLRPYNGARI